MKIAKKDYEALKKLYSNAVENNINIISYKGNKYFTGYLKYLLEFMEKFFGKNE